MSVDWKIRQGQASDVDAILGLIQELADYEKASAEPILTAEDILRDGFGAVPAFEVLIVEQEDRVIGMALTYERYSTWKGRSLYLEDLIVTESKRGIGIGAALMESITEKARKGNYGRLEWQVLDWNKPAIKFYADLNAELDESWVNCRISLK